MVAEISTATRTEVLEAIRGRYREASKRDKTRMLNEFVAMVGCHRKHAVRLLGQSDEPVERKVPRGRRIYDEAVRQALIVVWEASDRICGKRLKAALPSMVESLERHGHLDLDPDVRERLFSVSASTMDRLLRPVREQAGSRRRLKRRRKMGSRVPVRTFMDWNEPGPGYLEIDLVAHGGGGVSGAFIHSLVATDISSGWTEAVPLLAREQSLVVEGLEAISNVFPVQVRGIDSDNDSVFINETLVGYCEENEIEFTRSRAYRKNDQAWVEQKNVSVIRRFVGHERLPGAVAGQTMAHLYGAVRLYVNYFQPSFQLLAKSRNGGSVTKRYSKPATPATVCSIVMMLERRRSGGCGRADLTWTPCRCCTPYGSPSPHWQRSALSSQGAHPMGRVLRASCRSCPICGDRERYGRHTHGEYGLLAPGGHDRIRLKECGARFWAGSSSSPMRLPRN